MMVVRWSLVLVLFAGCGSATTSALDSPDASVAADAASVPAADAGPSDVDADPNPRPYAACGTVGGLPALAPDARGPFSLSRDGRALIRTVGDGIVEVWSTGTETETATGAALVRTLATDALGAALSADHARLAVIRARHVELLALADPAAPPRALDVVGATALALSADGAALLIATGDGALTEWSWDGTRGATAQAARAVVQIGATAAGWLTLSPDNFEGTYALWATDGTLARRAAIDVHGPDVDSADVTPDGRKLLVGSRFDRPRVLDIARGTTRTVERSDVHRARYAPDGRVVALNGPGGTGMVRQSGGNPGPDVGVPLLPQASGAVPYGLARLAFSADSRVLAVAAADGDTRLYCQRPR